MYIDFYLIKLPVMLYIAPKAFYLGMVITFIFVIFVKLHLAACHVKLRQQKGVGQNIRAEVYFYTYI